MSLGRSTRSLQKTHVLLSSSRKFLNNAVSVFKIEKGSTGDKTFYAKWTPTVYNIQYVYCDGATHSNVNSYTIEDETIPLSPATKKGHTFVGWYKQESGPYDGGKYFEEKYTNFYKMKVILDKNRRLNSKSSKIFA